jgi:two-component system chemotaxis sensor kinase CheA
MGFQIPEHLVRRFQVVSFERLDGIDAAWAALSHDRGTPSLEAQLHRDLHTLKGDARVIGFGDVSSLCQRLEDLFEVIRGRRYHVSEEVDVIVTMAIQFIGVLLRKRGGAPKGIDLDGFLRQIDDVLVALRRTTDAPSSAPATPHLSSLGLGASGPASSPRRLALDATWVYIEHLAAPRASSRKRLFDVWSSMVHEISTLETADLGPILEGHAEAGRQLARELGKLVSVSCDAQAELTIDASIADALRVAVLHGIRNAIDHGVEPGGLRVGRGKPETGAVVLEATRTKTHVVVRVRDDGGGIDLDAVRARATERGLLGPGEAASDERLHELLFTQGLSTRGRVTEISGRGVGLDAAREAMKAAGGAVTIRSVPGQGTTLEILAQRARAGIDVHTFDTPTAGARVAVEAGWAPAEAPTEGGEVDLDAVLDLVDGGPRGPSRVLAFSRDGATVRVLARGELRRETARRICRTPDVTPFEVVALADGHAILVRPGALGNHRGSA